MISETDFEACMRLAIDTTREGIMLGQSPFGAAVFDSNGSLVSREHNRVRELLDPSAHAEIMAIRSACRAVGEKQLSGHWIFATCEPCPMCASAIVFAGIRNVVFGSTVGDASEAGYSVLQIPCAGTFAAVNDEFLVREGILRDACRQLLRNKD